MKKFFTSQRPKRIVTSVLFIAILLFAGSTRFAHAQAASAVTGFFGDIAYTVVGKIVFVIAYLIAWISGVFIGIAAWLVGAILAINTGIFQSAIVQQGFGTSLAIANLGFVLGIIIIAIATILKSQSYGIKQVLWKLAVMAILVNFGLVIMAPIVGFGNSMTQYLLNCIDPTAGGCSTASNGLSSMNNFAKNLAGAFNPQVGFASLNTLNVTSTVNSATNIQGSFGVVGSDFGKMLVPIFSIGFVAVESIMVVIVLVTLMIMLLMRYLYITVLAVLLPFAWLAWVFPNTKSHFTRWWSELIRWTFFAPIVVFFLYLAMQTASGMSSAVSGSQSFGAYTSSSNAVWASISSLFTNVFTPIIGNILNIIVMLGLSIGGLIAANKLSIDGSGAAMKAVGVVGKGISNYAGKQSKKAGRLALQKSGGARISRSLQESRVGTQLKKIPVVGGVLGGIVGRGESLAGRGLSDISSNVALVDAAKKGIPNNPEEIRARLRGSMSTEDQLAHVAKLVEMGELRTKDAKGDDEMINGQSVKNFLDKNLAADSDIARRFGQVKMGSDADKAVGSNKAMRDAERALENLDIATTAGSAAVAKLDAATKTFVEKLGKADIKKMNLNEIFGKSTEVGQALSRAFLQYTPELVPGALAQMKSVPGNEFRTQYKRANAEAENKILSNSTLSKKEKDDQLAELREKMKSFNKAIKNNMTGSTESGDEASTPTSATTPPPSPTSAPTP